MFGINKFKKVRLELQKCRRELEIQHDRCGHLLRENINLTEKLRQSNLDVLGCKRKLQFPPAFREGEVLGDVEILEIKEYIPNDLPLWLSTICGIGGIALFIASASLLPESPAENINKPKYRYRIYNHRDKTERHVTEKEFCSIVGELR
jgi:hypothetical protein